MSHERIVDLALLVLLFGLSLGQAWITLRRTVAWDGLGRALLLMFVGKAILWSYAIAVRLWGPFPLWTLWLVRAELVAGGVLLVVALLRYPWPPAPPGIDWRGLFGRERRRDREG